MIGLNKIGLNRVELNRLYLNTVSPSEERRTDSGSAPGEDAYLLEDAILMEEGGVLLMEDGMAIVLES